MPDLLAVNHYRKNLRGNKLRFLFTILRAFAKYFKILYCGFSFGLGHILSTICSYHLLGYDDIPNMRISQQTKNDMHCLKCLLYQIIFIHLHVNKLILVLFVFFVIIEEYPLLSYERRVPFHR
ncbi:hypothetical protein ACJX0J_024999, partial [Zea mays]